MPSLFIVLCGLIFFATTASAATLCTIVADANTTKPFVQTGDCTARTTPASTFKVALAVMGYDAGILTDAHTPQWPWREGYPAFLDSWKQPTDPTAWLKNSVVWYSQVMTRQLGMARFAHDTAAFRYGNHDLSGNPGKHDGLTEAWLSSSLQISPVEQIGFLRKLVRHRLPASRRAQDMTTAIMPSFPLADGWTAHGKTGMGFAKAADGAVDHNRAIGWFVGWAENGHHTVLFARRIQDDTANPTPASFRARDTLLTDLPGLLARK